MSWFSCYLGPCHNNPIMQRLVLWPHIWLTSSLRHCYIISTNPARVVTRVSRLHPQPRALTQKPTHPPSPNDHFMPHIPHTLFAHHVCRRVLRTLCILTNKCTCEVDARAMQVGCSLDAHAMKSSKQDARVIKSSKHVIKHLPSLLIYALNTLRLVNLTLTHLDDAHYFQGSPCTPV